MLAKPRIPFKHFLLFGWMPSPLKKWAYKVLLGYRIGRHVRFGLFGVVVGESVDLADHVEIGMLAIVMGKTITIGRHSSVGTMSYVSCRTIEIGEDAKIREQVFVGGPQLPESRFTLGSRTIVLQMAYINPTKPVVIGDDTGIGGHCLIFTHGSWLNVLDGYPVNYEPVTLGNSVWLPWRVFVMPGSTIGDGSVIGANSLVSGTIPPYSLALGSPAKVVRSAPDFPKKLTDAERAAKVKEIMAEFDRYMQAEGVTITDDRNYRFYSRGRKRWPLVWPALGRDAGLMGGVTFLSEEPLSEETRASLRRHGAHWLDLGGKSRSEGGSPLTEELATFLARYGIRLPRDG
jgi:acetyltransferase-like isoleucine patch superfamily enzyme